MRQLFRTGMLVVALGGTLVGVAHAQDRVRIGDAFSVAWHAWGGLHPFIQRPSYCARPRIESGLATLGGDG